MLELDIAFAVGGGSVGCQAVGPRSFVLAFDLISTPASLGSDLGWCLFLLTMGSGACELLIIGLAGDLLLGSNVAPNVVLLCLKR